MPSTDAGAIMASTRRMSHGEQLARAARRVPDWVAFQYGDEGRSYTERYWLKPEATAEAFAGGWFHSGDLCTRDQKGFIRVVTRTKDMIVSGGENIYCAEVEAAIDSHPKVSEVAVIGVPHSRWVETPRAVVVPVNQDPPAEEEMIEHCRQRLASCKKPTSMVLAEALPRNVSGKVQKFKLRERAAQ